MFRPTKNALKKEAEKYINLTNKQWGHLSGMLIGLGLGLYVAINYDITKPVWPIEGTLENVGWFFNLIVRASVVPLSSGLFANLFSNMGSGIDIITDKTTLISLAFKKRNCSAK